MDLANPSSKTYNKLNKLKISKSILGNLAQEKLVVLHWSIRNIYRVKTQKESGEIILAACVLGRHMWCIEHSEDAQHYNRTVGLTWVLGQCSKIINLQADNIIQLTLTNLLRRAFPSVNIFSGCFYG